MKKGVQLLLLSNIWDLTSSINHMHAWIVKDTDLHRLPPSNRILEVVPLASFIVVAVIATPAIPARTGLNHVAPSSTLS
jgi:hypothetical protein